jgi:hypothetical protein
MDAATVGPVTEQAPTLAPRPPPSRQQLSQPLSYLAI